MSSDPLPLVAGTLQTDARSGGLKRSSGVIVLPIVEETWNEVRDDTNPEVDWLIAGYVQNSKTDITILDKGAGGVDRCAEALPENVPVFGGVRVHGRFATFFYTDEGTPPMQKGRGSMHKNGVLNILEGTDGEIGMHRGLTEGDLPIGGNARGSPRKSIPWSTVKRPAERLVATTSSKSKAPPASQPTQQVTQSFASAPAAGDIHPYNELRRAHLNEDEEFLTLPYEILKDIPGSQLPPSVDPANREKSLSQADFDRAFGMTRDAFRALATWKRSSLKKKAGLF